MFWQRGSLCKSEEFIDPKKLEKMHQKVTDSWEQLFGAILDVYNGF